MFGFYFLCLDSKENDTPINRSKYVPTRYWGLSGTPAPTAVAPRRGNLLLKKNKIYERHREILIVIFVLRPCVVSHAAASRQPTDSMSGKRGYGTETSVASQIPDGHVQDTATHNGRQADDTNPRTNPRTVLMYAWYYMLQQQQCHGL